MIMVLRQKGIYVQYFFYIFHDRIGTEAILHSSIYSKYHFRTLEFTDQLEGTTGEAVQYSNRVN